IGREARAQVLERYGRLPTTVAACVGGGSNALGIFHAFLDDREVELVGVEAAGEGLTSGRHAASLGRGRPGVFHGSLSYLLQDGDGQVQPAHSVSAGLDYPGVGPEHAYLKDSGRVLYVAVTDQEALGVLGAVPARGHPAGPGERARRGVGARAAGALACGRPRAHQPERSRRQGRRYGCRTDWSQALTGISRFPSSEPPAELALPPAQVEELMQVLVKGLRATQLYLPNNPVYQRA